MAVLAVLLPFVLLGMVLALGRYEEKVLPADQDPDAAPAAPRPTARHRRPRRAPLGG
ncbi:hypothetical protein [Streptomyces sp. JB150]|uniref:hypothetical protein n=1 Tax=Streptomyces sp. JB150 TaxID=2714844 RepID=UPI001407D353|nr:hypothetical protein [Streptomyces sp. JB150]QIJ65625.1 hypothetical protein G7Z13_29065 [Streptomyces sp. JB150]